MPDKEKPAKNDKKEKESALAPDKETLHTTDPQEHMKGPVSSIVQGIKETAEEEGGETPENDEKK